MSPGAGAPAPSPDTAGAPLGPRARGLLAILIIAALVGLGWFVATVLTSDEGDERPEVYSIDGTQPGDLTPGLDLLDNVRHYGLQVDLEYRFRTNRLGFRGPEPTGDGPVILLLGDSFAFGMGVDEGKTFADFLREGLRTKWPEVVVHNAAVPGYTITDQLEQWRQKLSAVTPDLVLVAHTASDLKEMARPTSFRRLSRWDDEDEAFADPDVAAVVARHGGEKAVAARQEWVFSQEQLLERLGAGAPVELAKLRDRYVEQLIALAEEVRAAGGQLMLLQWLQGYGMANLTAAPVRERAKAEGIPVHEGMKALYESGTPVDTLFLPDGHFSARANEILGHLTARWLESHLATTH